MDLTVIRAVVLGTVVDRNGLGLACQTLAHHDGGTDVRGHENIVALGGDGIPIDTVATLGQTLQGGVIGVVQLAVPDVGCADGAAPGSLPAVVGVQDLLTLAVYQMNSGQQGDVGLTVGAQGDTAVPPARSHGDQQGILPLGQVGCQIVGIVQHSLLVIRPAGLHLVEDLHTVLVEATHAAAVDPDIEHAQGGGVHTGGLEAVYGKLLAEQGDTAHVSDGSELVGAAEGVLPRVLLLPDHGGGVGVGDPLTETTGHVILAHRIKFLSENTAPRGDGRGRRSNRRLRE